MNCSNQIFKNKKFKKDELDNCNCSGCTFENCGFPDMITMSNFSRAKFINCTLPKFIDCNLSYVPLSGSVITVRCNRNMIEPSPVVEKPVIPKEVIPDKNNIIICPNCMAELKIKK